MENTYRVFKVTGKSSLFRDSDTGSEIVVFDLRNIEHEDFGSGVRIAKWCHNVASKSEQSSAATHVSGTMLAKQTDTPLTVSVHLLRISS
jgi:hypothetical protein